MITRILAITRKEFLHILRDRNTLALMFLIPIIQMIMLGYAATTNIENIAIAVWDADSSPISQRLINQFDATDQFDVARYVLSREQMESLLDQGVVHAGLIIPEDFGQDLMTGQGPEIELVLDGSDPMVANNIIAGVLQIAQAIARTQPQAPAGLLGIARPASVSFDTTVLYNPELKSVNYMIPALMGMILQFLATLLTSMAIVRERERGTIEQLIVTPIRAFELVIGKVAPYVLVAFLDLLEVLLIAVLWFKVPINGDVGLLLALSALFLLGALGLGILISTAAKTQQEAMLLSMLILLPSIFLSGFFFPLEAMPLVLRLIGYLVPLRYMLIIIRSLVLKGVGFQVLQSEAIILGVFCVVILANAARRFRKSLD